ncbi:hypothetical protein J6590_107970, partial [Homalodisca vitripennis]
DIDREAEKANERFVSIFNKYVHQPHLIDPYLDTFLLHIVELVRKSDSTLIVKNRAFKYLLSISSVRGYKIVCEHLSHEVNDLEPVLKLLEEQDTKDTESWQTRYGLILWLCTIVRLPFDINGFSISTCRESVSDRLLNTCFIYLMCNDACREVADFLSARVLTRKDMKQHINLFLNWAIEFSMKRAAIKIHGTRLVHWKA